MSNKLVRMNIDDIYEKYVLPDGQITRLEFSFDNKELNIELKIRKLVSKKKYEGCKVRLTFFDVKEFYIFEDFPTNGQYSDITFIKEDDDQLYTSFDPYGNSGQQNEQDNWIIKASNVKLTEI